MSLFVQMINRKKIEFKFILMKSFKSNLKIHFNKLFMTEDIYTEMWYRPNH